MPDGAAQKLATVARSLMERAHKLRHESIQLMEERMGEVRRMYDEALAMARQSGSRTEIVEGLKGLGQVERDAGRLDQALAYYEEALTLCHVDEEPLLFAHTLRHVGDIQLESGRPMEAGAAYAEAVKTYLAQPDAAPLDVANAIRSLAILKERTGDTRTATKMWQEARELYKTMGSADGIIESSQHLEQLAR